MYSIVSPKMQQKRQIRSQSNTIQKSQLSSGQSNLSINVNLEKNGYIDQSKEKFTKEGERLDEEFNQSILLIESALVKFNKHEKIRIEQWIKKLNQVTSNLVWKQNRNLYVKVLQDMVSNTTMYEPFTKVPPEGPLPRLTKFDIPYHARSIIRDFEKENENFNFDKLSFQNHSPSKFGQANLKNMRDKSNDKLRGNSSNSKFGSYLSINNNSYSNSNNTNNTNHNNNSINCGNTSNILGNLGQNQNNQSGISSIQPTLNKIPLPSSNHNSNQVQQNANNSCSHSSQSLVSGTRFNHNLSNEISNSIQRQSNLESNSNRNSQALNQIKPSGSSSGICATCKIYNHSKEDLKSPVQLQEKHQNLLNTVNSIFAERRTNSGNKNNMSGLSVNTNLLSDNQNYLNCQHSELKRQPSVESYQQSSYKRSGSCNGSTTYQKNDQSSSSTFQLPLSNINALKKNYSQNENVNEAPSKESSNNDLSELNAKNYLQKNNKSGISQFQYNNPNNNSQSTANDSKHIQTYGNYNTERQSHESLSGVQKQQQLSAYNSIENSSKNSMIENPQGGNSNSSGSGAQNSNFLVKDYLNQVDFLQRDIDKERELNGQLQMEIDLLKLNETDLKKENNLKQTHINQLTKNNERLKLENQQYKEKQIHFSAVLQKVSKYFQLHEDTMSDDLEYQYLLKELENIQQKTNESVLQTSPSSLGENRNHLKRKKRTELDQNYQQYAENIKQKLQQTNEGTNEFLSYLNRIKKNLD